MPLTLAHCFFNKRLSLKLSLKILQQLNFDDNVFLVNFEFSSYIATVTLLLICKCYWHFTKTRSVHLIQGSVKYLSYYLVNYFQQKAPSQMFGRLLNTFLYSHIFSAQLICQMKYFVYRCQYYYKLVIFAIAHTFFNICRN